MTPLLVGVIADTHGFVRPAVHQALAGVALILHAGDVGGDEVLDELGLVAPVVAVCGNCDPPGDPRLPARVERTIGAVSVHLSHGHELGAPTPERLLAAYPADLIIYGHTHRSLVHRTGDRIVLNPGAAGPPRFGLRPSVARLTIDGSAVAVEVLPLA